MIDRESILHAKILIVDDNPSNISLLEKLLRLSGYVNLISTTDARETVALFEEHRPDLILLDMKMPHLDGFQVMEQLHSIEGSSSVPTIVITAYNAPRLRLKALQEGAKDFIGKPFDFSEVLMRIRNMLEIRFLSKKLDTVMRPDVQ